MRTDELTALERIELSARRAQHSAAYAKNQEMAFTISNNVADTTAVLQNFRDAAPRVLSQAPNYANASGSPVLPKLNEVLHQIGK